MKGKLGGDPQPILECQAEVEDVHRCYIAKDTKNPPPSPKQTVRTPTYEDELLGRIFASKGGEEIRRLYQGDTSAYEDDWSRADLALAAKLLWWCDYDYAYADSLFRCSGLMRPKWDEEHSSDGRTYGQMTLEKAGEGKREGDGYQGVLKATQRHPEADPIVSRAGLLVNSDWPVLQQEALYGLVGEIVRLIDPHTEADPAAILLQLLAGFGAAVGKGPYYAVGATKHHANLFLALVGATAKGRKGTSLDWVKRLLSQADPTLDDRIVSGLSSGEGLIFHVRDGSAQYEAVLDKRLLVVETELSSALRVMSRKGNILSPVIRSAWDTGDLRTLTKNTPMKATGAHIGIIGHITQDELLRYLHDTELANGFANRFLFAGVRRSKVLPFGGSPPEEELRALGERLKDTLSIAKTFGSITMSPQARSKWISIYERLTDTPPGLFGSVIARSEAQVVRLALIYALLDASSQIELCHLEAALACWQYCEDSARFFFSKTVGDPIADTLLRELRKAPDGLSRTQISKVFHNRNQAKVTQALEELEQAGLIDQELRRGSGRAAEVWRILQ